MASTTSGDRELRGNVRGVNTRARLLDAALRSFAARGFEGTGTRDIAEAAGMSPAAVYTHYRTKEELLFRLSLDGHTAVRDLVAAAARSTDDPGTQLAVIGRDFARWHAQFHTHARVVQYEMAALTDEHRAQIGLLRREIQDIVQAVLERGVETGRFAAADLGTVARAIVSLGIDVARWYAPAGRLTPDEIGVQYAELSLRLAGDRELRPRGSTRSAGARRGQPAEG